MKHGKHTYSGTEQKIIFSALFRKERICTVALLWLFFFLSVSALVSLTLWFYNQAESVRNSSFLLAQIDSILDEATQSTDEVPELLSEPTGICTGEMAKRLSIIAVRHPHIRSVNLLQNGIIYCTSLPDNQGREVGTEFSGKPLYMREIKSTPENPVISLVRGQGKIRVMVSVDTYFIRNTINLAKGNKQWMFRVDNLFFTGDDVRLRTWKQDNESHRSIASSAYDYSILFKEQTTFVTLEFLLKTPVSVISVALLSLILAISGRILLERQRSMAVYLKQAIQKGEIYPVYQPVVDSGDYSIKGYEVLARWKINKKESIPPDVFIPLAEENGLLIAMTKSLMQQAEQQFTLLNRYGGSKECHLAFNFSYSCCVSEQFTEDCMAFLLQAKKSNIQLVVEITEREKIEPVPSFINNMNRLRHAGCLFALDDFGTGYSGISLMAYFTPDYIKLDKLFVSQITESRDRAELADSVIDMAKKLGINIIAEGVETHFQAAYLQSRGVKFLQGFYFYKPLSAIDIAKRILSENHPH